MCCGNSSALNGCKYTERIFRNNQKKFIHMKFVTIMDFRDYFRFAVGFQSVYWLIEGDGELIQEQIPSFRQQLLTKGFEPPSFFFAMGT